MKVTLQVFNNGHFGGFAARIVVGSKTYKVPAKIVAYHEQLNSAGDTDVVYGLASYDTQEEAMNAAREFAKSKFKRKAEGR